MGNEGTSKNNDMVNKQAMVFPLSKEELITLRILFLYEAGSKLSVEKISIVEVQGKRPELIAEYIVHSGKKELKVKQITNAEAPKIPDSKQPG
jgi:hypothetical protein